MRALGYKPDPADARDKDALKAIRTTTPPARVPRSPFTKTLNQGNLGSCTANAVAQAIRCSMIQQVVAASEMSLEEAQAAIEFMSRLFILYFAQAMDGTTGQDEGTYIRNLFKVANVLGFPPESAWPYSDDKTPGTAPFAKMPPSDAIRLAYDHRSLATEGLVAYHRISSTGYKRADDIQRAHADGFMVVFGTDVSNPFCDDMSANGGKPVDPPTRNIAGGHAMVTGGHDETGVDVLNSWGEEYGDGGWCKLSWNYMVWQQTQDLWIARHVPVFTPKEVHQ